MSACDSGDSDIGKVDPKTTADEAAFVQRDGVRKKITLAEGTGSRTHAIEAIDPPRHTFTVTLKASGSPDLKLWFTTLYGTRLNIAASTREDTGSCAARNGDMECRWLYPMLEAHKPGTWDLHLRKRTRPKTEVSVTVDFDPTG
jgi:hypothetical protein